MLTCYNQSISLQANGGPSNTSYTDLLAEVPAVAPPAYDGNGGNQFGGQQGGHQGGQFGGQQGGQQGGQFGGQQGGQQGGQYGMQQGGQYGGQQGGQYGGQQGGYGGLLQSICKPSPVEHLAFTCTMYNAITDTVPLALGSCMFAVVTLLGPITSILL